MSESVTNVIADEKPKTAGTTFEPLKTSLPKTGSIKTAGPKTSGGTVVATPWRVKQHEEIQALLASLPNNISCVCEICDCGQCVHNHRCKRFIHVNGNEEPFPTSHTHDIFKGTYLPPRSSKKPPPTPRETDLPPMVFETNQRNDFVLKPISMRKPASPPKPNYERPTGPLDGTSYYRQEFVPKKLSTPVKSVAIKPHIKTSADAKFYADTTNMDFFKQWQPAHTKPVEELPCVAMDILYPHKEKLPLSTTKEAFPGVYAPKPQQIKAAPDNLHVGGDGDFTTTTQNVYKGAYGPRAELFVPAPRPVAGRGPLMAETQTMADYPHKQIERVRPIDPLQPTIDLKFDNKTSFETEQRSIFNGHDVLQHPVPKSFKKVPATYERPMVPIEGLTVTHSVFTPKKLEDKQLRTVPQDHIVTDGPKFDGTTTNRELFKNWGAKVPYIYKHIDYADSYHPPQEKLIASSTTKEAFRTPLQTSIAKSCKPEAKPVASEGEHDFSTVNNSTYQGQIIKPCRARLWIMQQKLKEDFQRSRHNTPLIKSNPA